MVETLVCHSVDISFVDLTVLSSILTLHSLFRTCFSVHSRLFVRLKLLLVLETGNHRVLLVVVLFPSFEFILVNSLFMLGHVTIHFKSIILSLLHVKFGLVPRHLVLLAPEDTLVNNGILIEVLLNLSLLVVFDRHFVAFLSKLVILHLFDKLILVIHALTELLLLHEASSSIHAHHSFLLAFALVLGLTDLTLAFRATNSAEIVVVHTFL